MQSAVIEFSRNVLGLKDANSIRNESKNKKPCHLFDGKSKNNKTKRRNYEIRFLQMYNSINLMRTKHINAWKYLKDTDIDMNLTINTKINLKKLD